MLLELGGKVQEKQDGSPFAHWLALACSVALTVGVVVVLGRSEAPASERPATMVRTTASVRPVPLNAPQPSTFTYYLVDSVQQVTPLEPVLHRLGARSTGGAEARFLITAVNTPDDVARAYQATGEASLQALYAGSAETYDVVDLRAEAYNRVR